jgi:hypothetical protein
MIDHKMNRLIMIAIFYVLLLRLSSLTEASQLWNNPKAMPHSKLTSIYTTGRER